MQLICGALERIVFYVIHKSDEKSLTVNSETVLCNVSSMRRSVPLPDEIRIYTEKRVENTTSSGVF